jgi:beta-glucanase (GH16 family)
VRGFASSIKMLRAARSALVLLTVSSAAFPQITDSGWLLTFADEFSGNELDLAKWAPHDPAGRQRDWEVQAYVPGAITVGNGSAHIQADRGRAAYDGADREFTSGMMTSYGSFAQMYGRFEIRCRMPAGRGLEPKFWLLPVPSGNIPSIDVFDAIGSDPAKAWFGNVWGDEKTQRSYRGSYAVAGLASDFHTVAIEWDKDKIVWFVDGKERFRAVDGVPHQPMYLAVSLSLGGVQARYPDSTTHFPAVFDLDYVRVYQSAGAVRP